MSGGPAKRQNTGKKGGGSSKGQGGDKIAEIVALYPSKEERAKLLTKEELGKIQAHLGLEMSQLPDVMRRFKIGFFHVFPNGQTFLAYLNKRQKETVSGDNWPVPMIAAELADKVMLFCRLQVSATKYLTSESQDNLPPEIWKMIWENLESGLFEWECNCGKDFNCSCEDQRKELRAEALKILMQ